MTTEAQRRSSSSSVEESVGLDVMSDEAMQAKMQTLQQNLADGSAGEAR